MCAVTVVKTGQETRPEQLKGDCQVLLHSLFHFLDEVYDSNNILLVGKKKTVSWPLLWGSEEVLKLYFVMKIHILSSFFRC